jgi:hypothetical protein
MVSSKRVAVKIVGKLNLTVHGGKKLRNWRKRAYFLQQTQAKIHSTFGHVSDVGVNSSRSLQGESKMNMQKLSKLAVNLGKAQDSISAMTRILQDIVESAPSASTNIGSPKFPPFNVFFAWWKCHSDPEPEIIYGWFERQLRAGA